MKKLRWHYLSESDAKGDLVLLCKKLKNGHFQTKQSAEAACDKVYELNCQIEALRKAKKNLH